MGFNSRTAANRQLLSVSRSYSYHRGGVEVFFSLFLFDFCGSEGGRDFLLLLLLLHLLLLSLYIYPFFSFFFIDVSFSFCDI